MKLHDLIFIVLGQYLIHLYNRLRGRFKGGGCLFPCEVRPMGTWNNLQEGFTVNERLPDTLVDVAVCNVYFGVANIHRQKEQIKKPPCVTLVGYRVA